MPYVKPMLTELVVEFHLLPGVIGERQMLEIARLAAAAGFPEPQFLAAPDVLEAGVQTIGAGIVSARRFTSRIRCYSPDRSRMIQYSPGIFAVNAIGSYKSREDVISFVRGASRVLSDAVSDAWQSQCTKVTVIAINRADIHSRDWTFGKFFRVPSEFFPDALAGKSGPLNIAVNTELAGVFEEVGLSCAVNQDMVHIEMNATVSERVGGGVVRPERWIVALDRVRSIFEGMVGDGARMFMGGEAGGSSSSS